jgi:hypothetical protein
MDGELIKRRFLALAPFLDERLRRLYAAAEATVIGYGGISLVSRETGISRRAIAQGYKELKHPPTQVTSPCSQARWRAEAGYYQGSHVAPGFRKFGGAGHLW